MRRFTASFSALLAHGCNAWLADAAQWDESGSEAATLGSEKHALLQSAVDGSDPGEVSERAREAAEVFAPLLEELASRGEAIAELALAWDPVSGKAVELGRGLGRDYSAAPDGWAVGSFDLAVLLDEDRAILVDYKSWSPGQPLPDAREQLRTGALMAARAWGLSSVEIRTGLAGESAARWDAEEVLDADAIDAIAEERASQLTRPIGEPVPGPWCHEHYCPHRAHCPVAQRAEADLLAPEAPRHLAIIVDSDEAALTNLAMLKLVDERVKTIKAATLAYIDGRGGVAGPDGRVYSNVPQTSEKADLSAPGATEEIVMAGGSGAIKLSLTWTDLAKAVGAARATALRDALRNMGALKATTRPHYDWRRTGDQKAETKSRKPRKEAQ